MNILPDPLRIKIEQIKQQEENDDEDEEVEELTLNEDEVKQLLQTIKAQKEVKQISQLLEILGDLARQEHVRSPIISQKEEVKQSLLPLFEINDADVRKFVARAIGNLCFDNPEASTFLCEDGLLLPKLIENFSLFANDDIVLRNTAGALANLASDNETVDTRIGELDGIRPLIKLVRETQVITCKKMAARALCNIVTDSDSNLETFVKEGGYEAFLSFRTSDDNGLQKELLNIIILFCDKDSTREHAIKSGAIQLLVKMAKSEAPFEDLEENAWEVLSALADRDDLKAHFVSSGAFQELHAFAETQDIATQQKLVKIFGNISLEDKNIAPLYNQYFEYALSLLERTEIEFLVSSLMALGNMARIDDQCIKMGLNPLLIESLKKMCDHTDIRVQHLAVGVFRNLSVPAENKSILVNHGLLAILIKVLQDRVRPSLHLQYAAIGTIRSLVATNASFLNRLVQEGGFDALVAIARGEIIPKDVLDDKDDDGNPKPRDRRVEFEAARILARFADSPEHISLFRKESVEPLMVLINSPYPILQNEGLKALLCLASNDQARQEVLAANVVAGIEDLKVQDQPLLQMQQQLLNALKNNQ